MRRRPKSEYAGITAALVTRGDVDLRVLLGSLPFDTVNVWNNAERPQDLSCYGRFEAAREIKSRWYYTQDDDLLVPIPALVREWRQLGCPPLLANRPSGEPWRFLGCGAIFHRSLLRRLKRYLKVYGAGAETFRIADIAFAYQAPYRSVDVGYLDFPWQTAPNRMYHELDHYVVRQLAVERVAERGWLCPEVPLT